MKKLSIARLFLFAPLASLNSLFIAVLKISFGLSGTRCSSKVSIGNCFQELPYYQRAFFEITKISRQQLLAGLLSEFLPFVARHAD
jgi:hypothetical protein